MSTVSRIVKKLERQS